MLNWSRTASCLAFGLLLLTGSFPCTGFAELMVFQDGLGLDYGIGFDTLIYNGRQSPFPTPPRLAPGLSGGPDQYIDVQRIESSSVIEQLFSASAEVGYGVPALGAGVSVETDYLKTHSISAYTLSYVLRAGASLPETKIQDPQLTTQAKAALAQGLPGFRAAYGDTFVRAVVTGGKYYGTIDIKTFTESDLEQLKANLKGSYNGFGAEASFEEELKKVNVEKQLIVRQSQQGGPSLQSVNTPAGLDRNANIFMSYIFANPTSGRPVAVDLADYLMFPEYYSVYSDLGYEKRVLLAELQRNYIEYILIRNTLQYVQQNDREFRFNPQTRAAVLSEIATKKNQVGMTLALIQQRWKDVASGGNNSTTLAALGVQPASDFALTLRLPARYKGWIRPPNTEGYWEETFPPQTMYPLQTLARGDAEMNGHYPTTTAHAALVLGNGGKTLELHFSVSMVEDRPDYTTFQDARSLLIPVLDLRGKGYSIKRIISPTTSPDIVWKAGKDFHDWHLITPTNPANSIIAQANCRSDVSGKDAGKVGCTNILFNNVRLEYIHDEDIPTGPTATVQPYYDAPATASSPSPVTLKVFAGKFVPVNRTLLMRPKRAVQAVPSQTMQLFVPMNQNIVQQPVQAVPQQQAPTVPLQQAPKPLTPKPLTPKPLTPILVK